MYAAVKECLLEFNILQHIAMIITDTASVNAGKHSAAVKRLCNEMQDNPFYYPSQLLVMDEHFH